MRRQHPLTTLVGIALTLLFLVGLALHAWSNGGIAFSPGRVSALAKSGVEISGYSSHANFEGDCKQCHKPLSVSQDSLCMNCHEDVAQQIDNRKGTHSYISSEERCAYCHADHRGLEYDLTVAAFEKFNHTRTDFSLAKHGYDYESSSISCYTCHENQADFSILDESCVKCHAQSNPDFGLHHIERYGDNCLVCHDGVDRMVAFNHESTDFPLEGGHVGVSCTHCHRISEYSQPQENVQNTSGEFLIRNALIDPEESDPFTNTPRECVACHEEPALHENIFSADCGKCHTTEAWSTARLNGIEFNHSTQTVFTLDHHRRDYSGAQINCYECHGKQFNDFQVNTCIDCHNQDTGNPNFISVHIEKYGTVCLNCHDGIDRMESFNHDSFFRLEGNHTEIDCSTCHSNFAYRGTPRECYECHTEAEIHAGFFGQKCQYCHNQSGWSPAYLSVHPFPLEHGSQEPSPCLSCHIDRYKDYNCYGCHEHQRETVLTSHLQAGIPEVNIPACVTCHQEVSGQQ